MEKNQTMTDEQLARELQNGKRGGGRGFFDVGKGKEPPDALRRRFTRELKWCTDMIDVFRPAAE